MKRFVNRQNIDRYRQLAAEATSDRERLKIMQLLAEEEAKIKLDLAASDLGRVATTN